MLKYECPHCHKRTISFWRWEPFREYFRHYPDIPALPNPIVCPQCGGRATMRFWPAALWGALPLFALIVGHDFFWMGAVHVDPHGRGSGRWHVATASIHIVEQRMMSNHLCE